MTKWRHIHSMEDRLFWGHEMSFAARLGQFRKERSLTQQALADLAGIRMMQVHRYESGSARPSLDALKKLTVALRVSADQLLFEDGERGPDDELKYQFEAVSRLDPEEKLVIREVVESILLKHDAKRWTQTSAANTPARRARRPKNPNTARRPYCGFSG